MLKLDVQNKRAFLTTNHCWSLTITARLLVTFHQRGTIGVAAVRPNQLMQPMVKNRNTRPINESALQWGDDIS